MIDDQIRDDDPPLNPDDDPPLYPDDEWPDDKWPDGDWPHVPIDPDDDDEYPLWDGFTPDQLSILERLSASADDIVRGGFGHHRWELIETT